MFETPDEERQHLVEVDSAAQTFPKIEVTIDAALDGLGIWHTDVYLNGECVGGGTSPHGFLSLADEILYGDTNDRLNGSEGALGDLLAEQAT